MNKSLTYSGHLIRGKPSVRLTYNCIDCGKMKLFYPSEIFGKSARYELKNNEYRCRKCWNEIRKGKPIYDNSKPKVRIVCTNCKSEKILNPSEAKKLNDPYYCIKCFGETRRDRAVITCADCGSTKTVKMFTVNKYIDKEYYCLKCKNKGERNFSWDGGEKELVCDGCGHITVVRNNRYVSVKARAEKYYCSKCYHSYCSIGEQNSNWRGGTSFEPYPTKWKEQLKEAIRERDGHECQLCGKNQCDMEYKLDVHHIDYDKENLDPYNLLSLCRSCHTKTNFHREGWLMLFNEKVLA